MIVNTTRYSYYYQFIIIIIIIIIVQKHSLQNLPLATCYWLCNEMNNNAGVRWSESHHLSTVVCHWKYFKIRFYRVYTAIIKDVFHLTKHAFTLYLVKLFRLLLLSGCWFSRLCSGLIKNSSLQDMRASSRPNDWFHKTGSSLRESVMVRFWYPD